MQDLTKGSIAGHLVKTTSFMLVTMLFQTLYFLVDLYWVGRLGKEAVAGVGVAGNMTFIVLAVTQMLGVGATTLVSHAVGRKDPERANLVFNQALVLSALVGAVFFAVMMALRTAYARGLAADAESAELAGRYLLWFIPAMALQFPMVAMGSAMRGTGNFVPGMIVQTATIIINMILAPFLIFGWGTGRPLGVAGAAIASLVAIVIGTLWFLTFFVRKTSGLRIITADWKPQVPLWGQMLRIGLPAGAEFAMMGVYLFIVYVLSRPFGSAAQAGFGIGMRVLQAGFMPVVALGFAVAPVAGQNVGARRSDRVRETYRIAIVAASTLMVLLTVLCHVVPTQMIRGFSSDPQVLAVGTEYLNLISWSFVLSGIVFVSSSMFQALGNTVPSLAASVVRVLLVATPAIALSRLPGFKLSSIWMLSVGAITVQTALIVFLLLREFRLKLPAAAPDAVPDGGEPHATIADGA
jgi:putative MATE family efflux protein